MPKLIIVDPAPSYTEDAYNQEGDLLIQPTLPERPAEIAEGFYVVLQYVDDTTALPTYRPIQQFLNRPIRVTIETLDEKPPIGTIDLLP